MSENKKEWRPKRIEFGPWDVIDLENRFFGYTGLELVAKNNYVDFLSINSSAMQSILSHIMMEILNGVEPMPFKYKKINRDENGN
jgi:hypothetical protein